MQGASAEPPVHLRMNPFEIFLHLLKCLSFFQQFLKLAASSINCLVSFYLDLLDASFNLLHMALQLPNDPFSVNFIMHAGPFQKAICMCMLHLTVARVLSEPRCEMKKCCIRTNFILFHNRARNFSQMQVRNRKSRIINHITERISSKNMIDQSTSALEARHRY